MKRTFEVDGKNYAVITPDAKTRRESQVEHSRTFGKLLKEDGVLTRAELDKLIEKKELWNEESRNKYNDLNTRIDKNVAKLEAGGMTLPIARELALSIADDRAELNVLRNEYRQYDDITADAQAEAAAFDYLIANCLVDDDTGNKIYESYDAYVEDKDSTVASMAYINMLQLEHGSTNDLYKKLPENKFLLEWNFVNEDLRFIDREGRLTDKDGKLVNEDGEYTEQTQEVVEPKPFLDDDGNPIIKTA
jgi:hypothetical protein